MIPVFPATEFAGRHERARRRMDEQGLRALVVASPGNQFWLSGFRGPGFSSGTASYIATMVTPRILLPLAGEPVLLGLAVAQPAYQRETHFNEIRPLVNPVGEAARAIREALDGLGIRSGKIGVDLGAPGGFSHGEVERLRAALAALEIVDAAGLLSELRMVKSAAEIAVLRRAVEIQNDAFRRFLPRLSRKMSDADLRWELHKAQMESGASDASLTLISGHPAAAFFGIPSDEPAPERGLRWIDGGVSIDGYQSDYDILVAWGEPSRQAVDLHASLVDTHAEAMKSFRPGRSLADIGQDVHAMLVARGVDDPLDGAFHGHCLGFDVVERPWFGRHASRKLALEPGMVISPEWMTRTALGTFAWEENLLVTESGLEKLSAGPHELPVVSD